MAKTQTLVCDRCGVEDITVIHRPESGGIYFGSWTLGGAQSWGQFKDQTWSPVDLCPVCVAAFRGWLEAKQEDDDEI